MEVPQKFIEIVNKIGDEVLSDDKKSAQWDWSNHLVGKVHKEVQIPIVNKEDGDYCKDILTVISVIFVDYRYLHLFVYFTYKVI